MELAYGKRGDDPNQISIQTSDGAKQKLSLEQRVHGSAGALLPLHRGENSVRVDLDGPGELQVEGIRLSK